MGSGDVAVQAAVIGYGVTLLRTAGIAMHKGPELDSELNKCLAEFKSSGDIKPLFLAGDRVLGPNWEDTVYGDREKELTALKVILGKVRDGEEN